MKRTKVTIFRRAGAPFYQCQWFDPLTGKRKRQSTGTANEREAERKAARLEDDINAGRQSAFRTTWEDFKTRYKNEVVAFKSPAQGVKVNQAFGHVDRVISPKFARSLDGGEVSRLSAKLLAEGKSSATVGSVLRTLKAALRWGARLELIPKAPAITMPANSDKAGGRPPTGEEFDKIIAEAKKSHTDKEIAAKRVRFLQGLWWSGLRLNEALRLHWVDDRLITIDLRGPRPMFDIKSEADKGRKDRKFPIAPEFAEMLLAVPEEEREGFVLDYPNDFGKRGDFFEASKGISALGKAAKVVVDHDAQGEPAYASAHDLRRSFGTRWAKRVMPPVLKLLMRHASIATTMKYYVDIDAAEAAEALYEAISKDAGRGAKSGATTKTPKKDSRRKS